MKEAQLPHFHYAAVFSSNLLQKYEIYWNVRSKCAIMKRILTERLSDLCHRWPSAISVPDHPLVKRILPANSQYASFCSSQLLLFGTNQGTWWKLPRHFQITRVRQLKAIPVPTIFRDYVKNIQKCHSVDLLRSRSHSTETWSVLHGQICACVL